jgi:hypothetical protein
MAATVIIRDEEMTGRVVQEFSLEFPAETITVRELIRSRVYQEVKDHNVTASSHVFQGLVQPEEAEQKLNGPRERVRGQINWKKQFDKAVEAFTQGKMLVLVGDQQAETLEQPIVIAAKTEVTFMRLVPLAGG